MAPGIRRILATLATAFALLSIHESGHIAAAWLTGGSVQEIELASLRPHVMISGRTGPAQAAWRAIAGSATSVLACFAIILFLPAASVVRDTAAVFGGIEILGWSLSSIWPTASASPDDTARFLTASGASAFPILVACAILAIAGTVLFLRRSVQSAPTPLKTLAAVAGK